MLSNLFSTPRKHSSTLQAEVRSPDGTIDNTFFITLVRREKEG